MQNIKLFHEYHYPVLPHHQSLTLTLMPSHSNSPDNKISKFAPKHLPKCQVLCVFHLLYTYSKDVIFALKSEVLSIQCKTDRREAPNFRTINSILRRKNHNAYLSIDLK